MLYLFLGNREGEEFIHQASHFLSAQRREKMERLHALNDRVNCCAVFLLLRIALWQEYGISDQPLFGFGEKDKPFLIDLPDIRFNFSHCKNGAACIVSGQNTAVDIMELRKPHAAVYRRCCSPGECAALEQSTEPDRDFIKLWTRKECYAKLLGKGLSLDFRTLTDSLPEMRRIHTIDEPERVISYYSEKEEYINRFDASSLLQTAETIGEVIYRHKRN